MPFYGQGDPEPPQSGFSEEFRQSIREQIERTSQNAISIEKLGELQTAQLEILQRFVNTGQRDPEDEREEEKIKQEFSTCTVTVQNLGEFQVLLEETYLKFHIRGNVQGEVAHENAHANVAQSVGAIFNGYGITFVLNSEGTISAMSTVDNDPDPEWTPRELLLKMIDIVKAPEAYGETLSPSDKRQMEFLQELLEKLEDKE